MKHEPLLGHAGLLQLASSPAPKFERFCRDQHSLPASRCARPNQQGSCSPHLSHSFNFFDRANALMVLYSRLSMDRIGRQAMKSPVVKRSIVIAGHKTSVSLEDAFWEGLKEIAGGRDTTLSDLVAAIDSGRRHGNLSSAIRLFVLDYYRKQLPDHQEKQAGARAA